MSAPASNPPFVPLLLPPWARGGYVPPKPVSYEERVAGLPADTAFDAASFVSGLPSLPLGELAGSLKSVLITGPAKSGKTTLATAVLSAQAPSLPGGKYEPATPLQEPALKSVVAMNVTERTGYLAEVSTTLLSQDSGKEALDAVAAAFKGVPNLTIVATTDAHVVVPRDAAALRTGSVRCVLPGALISDLYNAWASTFSAVAPFSDARLGAQRFYAAVRALPQYTALAVYAAADGLKLYTVRAAA